MPASFVVVSVNHIQDRSNDFEPFFIARGSVITVEQHIVAKLKLNPLPNHYHYVTTIPDAHTDTT
jgi:hypothetical protein